MTAASTPRFCVALPAVPKLTVTVITRNEAANIDAALASVGLGRRDRRRRLREHRRHGGDRAAARRPRRDAGRGPATARRRTTPRRSRRTTGSCRSTPTSASRRRWRPRSGALLATRARQHAATGCRASPGTSGRWIRAHRLVSGLPAAALRSARRAVERPPRPRIGAPDGRRAGPARARARSTSPTATSRDHLATIDRYTTLAARADGGRRAARRRSPASSCHPPFAFLRNYVLRRRVHGRRGRASSCRS